MEGPALKLYTRFIRGYLLNSFLHPSSKRRAAPCFVDLFFTTPVLYALRLPARKQNTFVKIPKKVENCRGQPANKYRCAQYRNRYFYKRKMLIAKTAKK
jgi:hypothetical protein